MLSELVVIATATSLVCGWAYDQKPASGSNQDPTAVLLRTEATGMEAGTMDTTRILIDFSTEGEEARWSAVNDGVMGGLSDGQLVTASDSTAFFEGILSLENNGGFASVRRELARYPLTGANAVILDVRGDGRRYQLRARTDDRFDGVAYRAFIDTIDGVWQRIEIPFNEFRATFRGRSVPGAPVLEPAEIQQLAFLIADKRPGAFRLEIRRIEAVMDVAADQMR